MTSQRTLFDAAELETGGRTLVDRLARLFKARPGAWIDGRALARVGGTYAWRTRLSELRRAPHNLTIENRQRRVVTAGGQRVVTSEYRLIPADSAGQEVSTSAT